jgi:cobyrinic acid a,c-diamide synthase
MSMQLPRLVVAGAAGDTGKTIISLALTAALRKRGLSVAPYKKGPDFIDAAWLSLLAERPCRNLDTFMVAPDAVLCTFAEKAADADCAIVEGNRGLFDGRDVEGTHSTAALAKLLDAPVILAVDCRKVTRTVAAVINGCKSFDPKVKIAGVILNRIAGERHERLIADVVEQYCGLPVLGAIPSLPGENLIPGRHLGLVTPAEYQARHPVREKLEEIGDMYLDIDAIIEMARSAPVLNTVAKSEMPLPEADVRIGYFCDSAFTFYYPDNLEALRENGAQLVPVSSLSDSTLPAVDGLYIGGGFPETHLERLAGNTELMRSVQKAIDDGLPVYAECGGLMYLARSLRFKDSRISLAGVFPLDLVMHQKPIGHGYVEGTVTGATPYFAAGTHLRGHEFHYSGPAAASSKVSTCLDLSIGRGLGNRRDGLIYKNCLACYIHIHARGMTDWAPAFTGVARKFKESRQTQQAGRSRQKIDPKISNRGLAMVAEKIS